MGSQWLREREREGGEREQTSGKQGNMGGKKKKKTKVKGPAMTIFCLALQAINTPD